MSIQISLKLSDKMFNSAKLYVENYGFDNLQDFIRETLREKLFEQEEISGRLTYLASEKSLAKNWLSKEDDENEGGLGIGMGVGNCELGLKIKTLFSFIPLNITPRSNFYFINNY